VVSVLNIKDAQPDDPQFIFGNKNMTVINWCYIATQNFMQTKYLHVVSYI